MIVFQYHSDIIQQFPDIVGGIILGKNVANIPTPPDLQAEYRAEQQATLKRIGKLSFGDIPPLSAWRSAFRSFNVEPTKYRSAPESLLRRLRKKGNIPNINALVDIGNIISIRYAIPIAVCDTRHIDGPLTVHFAEGDERYTTLGTDEIIHPDPGEVVFTDPSRLVFARRWCWRQSAHSASTLDTTDILVTVEALHEDGHATVESAVKDMLDLLHQYAGGTYTSTILEANNPVLER